MSYVLSAACLQKYPGTPKGIHGAAINGKLTELRLKAKKPGGQSEAQRNDDQELMRSVTAAAPPPPSRRVPLVAT